jgi:outer membrane lipoprotein-sorting protein
VTNDGHGRIELQSDAGDVQIVWSPDKVSVYDASSNTAYELALPTQQSSSSTTDNGSPPTIDDISNFLSHVTQHVGLSDAVPGVLAGQGEYTVSVTPKENGGLIGSAALAWDALNGTPLKLAVYAKGNSTPALSLEATDISFAPVAASDVDISPPPGAKVVDLSAQHSGGTGSGSDTEVTGLAAVQAAVPFTVAAPDTLNGLSRSQVRLAGKSVLVVYGEGLGSILVVESATDGGSAGGGEGVGVMGALPTVSIGNERAKELATELGTVLEWQHDGVSFVLAGSVSPADAEAAAGALG